MYWLGRWRSTTFHCNHGHYSRPDTRTLEMQATTITTREGHATQPNAPHRAATTDRSEALDLSHARRSVSSFFLLLGVAVATWAALVPSVKSGLGLTDASLGGVLLAFGGGTIVATLLATSLVRRAGSGRTLAVVGIGLALVLPFLTIAPSPLALALLLFG